MMMREPGQAVEARGPLVDVILLHVARLLQRARRRQALDPFQPERGDVGELD